MATLFKLLLLLLLLLSFFFFFFKTNIYLFTYMKQQMFHLTTYSTHFIYGYMASDIWLMTTQIAREDGTAASWDTRSDKVRSGQVRVFNVHIQSKLL